MFRPYGSLEVMTAQKRFKCALQGPALTRKNPDVLLWLLRGTHTHQRSELPLIRGPRAAGKFKNQKLTSVPHSRRSGLFVDKHERKPRRPQKTEVTLPFGQTWSHSILGFLPKHDVDGSEQRVLSPLSHLVSSGGRNGSAISSHNTCEVLNRKTLV